MCFRDSVALTDYFVLTFIAAKSFSSASDLSVDPPTVNVAHDNNLMSAPESSHQKKRSADQKIAQTGVGLSTTCGRWITAIFTLQKCTPCCSG